MELGPGTVVDLHDIFYSTEGGIIQFFEFMGFDLNSYSLDPIPVVTPIHPSKFKVPNEPIKLHLNFGNLYTPSYSLLDIRYSNTSIISSPSDITVEIRHFSKTSGFCYAAKNLGELYTANFTGKLMALYIKSNRSDGKIPPFKITNKTDNSIVYQKTNYSDKELSVNVVRDSQYLDLIFE